MRKQARMAGPGVLHPGLMPKEPGWDVSADHYMQGRATNEGERFRGKHGPNMLFIFDEGPGIPLWAWDEAENMCTAPNNRILAIGNPIVTGGPYHECFKPESDWETLTLNCLDHPNVRENSEVIPGAASREYVERQIGKHCVRIAADEAQGFDFEWPVGSGIWYHPDAYFLGHVLGEFPEQGPDCLVSTAWMYQARNVQIPIDETTVVDVGVDVARKGLDYCVAFTRRGPSFLERRKWQGKDVERSKREVAHLIREQNAAGLRVGTVAIDAIGIGAGLADSLALMAEEGEIRCERVLAIQVSERADDPERYADKRSELAFRFAERLRVGGVDLTRLGEDADDLESQATQIMTDYDRLGRSRVEEKDKIRERVGVSPDDFDAAALCTIDTTDTFAEDYAAVMSAM